MENSNFLYDLRGTMDELPQIEAIGRQTSKYPALLPGIVNTTALEKLQKFADTQLSSNYINPEVYKTLQDGFNKINETKDFMKKVIEAFKQNDLPSLQKYFTTHPEIASFPSLLQTGFVYCRTIEIAQFLLEKGGQLESIHETDWEDTVLKLALDKKFDLLDFYAKQGVDTKSLFTLITTGNRCSIEFKGCETHPSEMGTLAGYIDYPYLTEALHDFIEQDVSENGNDNLGLILEHFGMHGDPEGIARALNKLTEDRKIEFYPKTFTIIKSAIYVAIQWGNLAVLKEILNFVPFDKILPKQQIVIIEFASSVGYLDIENFLSTKLQLTRDRFKSLKDHNEWFNSGAEIVFPVLKGYQTMDRALNSLHWTYYGGDLIQQTFRQKQRESVLEALWKFKELKNLDLDQLVDDNEKLDMLLLFFNELLECLGNRRGHIASLCRTRYLYKFGQIRKTTLKTSLSGAYEKYDELIKEGSRKTLIKLDNKNYVLSEILKQPDQPAEVINSYNDFFNPDDPLFKYTTRIFGNIILKAYESRQELRKEIAKLHWMLAHISPFSRGSASISEVITDALWLYHGYLPQPFEAGKSADLEAMLAINFTAFQQIYPLGRKI
jgi:hypothetical protein